MLVFDECFLAHPVWQTTGAAAHHTITIIVVGPHSEEVPAFMTVIRCDSVRKRPNPPSYGMRPLLPPAPCFCCCSFAISCRSASAQLSTAADLPAAAIQLLLKRHVV
jgi:hypothetical protein